MTTEESIKERSSFGGKPMQELAYRIGILISSYAQAINKQNGTTGSLFQHKTKAKILQEEINGKRESYLESCFLYIHQNPLTAGLVKNSGDWRYSSYQDYAGLRNGSLCAKELFYLHSGLTQHDIIVDTKINFPEEMMEKLFC